MEDVITIEYILGQHRRMLHMPSLNVPTLLPPALRFDQVKGLAEGDAVGQEARDDCGVALHLPGRRGGRAHQDAEELRPVAGQRQLHVLPRDALVGQQNAVPPLHIEGLIL